MPEVGPSAALAPVKTSKPPGSRNWLARCAVVTALFTLACHANHQQYIHAVIDDAKQMYVHNRTTSKQKSKQ
jgi:hypothetical protein